MQSDGARIRRRSVIVKKSLVDPLIPLGDWEMLGENPS